MFNSSNFFIFAGQGHTGAQFSGGTAQNLYRDFVTYKQLNGGASSIGPNIDFIRNTFGTFFNSLCTLETAGINTPRFEYTPTGTYKGLLIEDQSTNLIDYSNNFKAGNWSTPLTGVSFLTNVAGISAPDNTESVTLMTNTSSGTYHVVSWGELPVPPNEQIALADKYDRSIFIKKDTARYIVITCSPAPSAESVTSIFDFDLPGFVTSSTLATYYTPLKNGWYRIGFNRLSTNGNTNRLTIGIASGPDWTNASFSGNQSLLSGVYIWGAQAEKGFYPTSYIPTNGTEVTRAPDNATISGKPFTLFYNPSASSFYIKASRNNVQNLDTYATFTNNIATKYWSLGTAISAETHTLTNTSMLTSAIESGPVTDNTIYTLAVALRDYDFIFYQNQQLVNKFTTGFMPQKPSSLNQFQLGRFLNTDYLNGHIREFGYWPTRLTNQLLSAL